MSAGIQCRVRQHGYPDEFYPVQNSARCVPPPASSPGLTASVDMESKLVGFVASCRSDGIIGAGQIAHGTTDAGISRVGFLPDAVIYGKDVSRAFGKIEGGLNDPLAKYTQLNGTDRTDRRTASAKGAFLLAPKDLPGEILNA